MGTVKQVHLDGDAVRTYVAVDGGMSDNIRTALYAAEYSATLASRRSEAGPAICPGGGQALRGRRHPGPRRVPARRHRTRGPARRPGQRGLQPVDGQQLQPRAEAARGLGPGRTGVHPAAARDPGRPPPAGRRVARVTTGTAPWGRMNCRSTIGVWPAEDRWPA